MGGQIFSNASDNNLNDAVIDNTPNVVIAPTNNDANSATPSQKSTTTVGTTTTNNEANLATPSQKSTTTVGTTTTNNEALAIQSQKNLPSVGTMNTASIIALLALPILLLLALIDYIFRRKKEKHRAIALTKRNLVTVIDKLHGNGKELKTLQLSLKKTPGGKTFHPYNLRFQDIIIDWRMIKTTEKIYLLRDSTNLFHSVEQIHETFKSVSQYPSATTQGEIKSLIINIQTQLDSAHGILLRSRDMLEITHVLEKRDRLFRFVSGVKENALFIEEEQRVLKEYDNSLMS